MRARRPVGRLLVLAAAGLALGVAAPAAVHSEAGATAPAGTSPDAPPAVSRWLPSRGWECMGPGKYRKFCQGPRKAPAPFGEAGALAKKLGLGTDKIVSHLILRPPSEALRAAAGGVPNQKAQRDPHMLWPVPSGRFWRGFGPVERGPKRRKRHRGIDIGAPKGTPIVAAKAGLVAYADNGVRGYGNMLVVVHPDGTVANYAHCSAIYVFPGQRVARGQRVADVGHTGIARGSHLHFEYRRRGRPRDPLPLFENLPQDDRQLERYWRKRGRRRR